MSTPSRLGALLATLALAAGSLTACDRMNSSTPTPTTGPASAASR